MSANEPFPANVAHFAFLTDSRVPLKMLQPGEAFIAVIASKTPLALLEHGGCVEVEAGKEEGWRKLEKGSFISFIRLHMLALGPIVTKRMRRGVGDGEDRH